MDSRFEVRIELRKQNRLGHLFRISITAVLNEEVRIRNPRFRELCDGRIALRGCCGPFRNFVKRIQVADIRGFKVLVFGGLVAFCDQFVREEDVFLAADNLPVGDRNDILSGESRGGKNRQESQHRRANPSGLRHGLPAHVLNRMGWKPMPRPEGTCVVGGALFHRKFIVGEEWWMRHREWPRTESPLHSERQQPDPRPRI